MIRNVRMGLGAVLVLATALLTALTASALARPAPGDFDRSFSGNGKVTTSFATHNCGNGDYSCDDYARSVALDSRGRIVASGVAGTENGDFAVARWKRDGRLDPTFGGDGKVRTDLGGDDYARSMAIDSKDRVVQAGYSDRAGNPSPVLVRYRPDGSLDRSFGGDGKVAAEFGTAVAVDSSDRIIAVGGRRSFGIARYKPDGTLDPTFGDQGTVATRFPKPAEADAVAINSRGRIVVLGSVTGTFPIHRVRFALAQYMPDGSLDDSFSGNGMKETQFGYYADPNDVTVDSHDQIIAAGRVQFRKGPGFGDEFALVRYKPHGTLDDSFSGNGKVRTEFRGAYAQSVALDSRGRIVAAGQNIVRYRPDGSLDHSLAEDGKLLTEFGDPYAVTTDSKDRIVAAGSQDRRHRGRKAPTWALARYIGY